MSTTPDRPAVRADNPDVRHEESDVDVRSILWAGGVLVALAVVVHVGVWVLYQRFTQREDVAKGNRYPTVLGEERSLNERLRAIPEPRLEGLAEFSRPLRMPEGEKIGQGGRQPYVRPEDLQPGARPPSLQEYGWVDRQEGVVRIPIQEAMRLVAEHHLLPSREEKGAGRKGQGGNATAGPSPGRAARGKEKP